MAALASSATAAAQTKRPRPPYFDPTTGMRYDTSNGSFEGWLTKQSEWLKDWRRRYFVLKGDKLFFSKSQWSVPHGMIDLSLCQTVKSAEHKAGKKFAMEVSTKETTFFMYADSEKEKDEWIGVIGRAIVQASSTLMKDEGGAGGDDNESEEEHDLPSNPNG